MLTIGLVVAGGDAKVEQLVPHPPQVAIDLEQLVQDGGAVRVILRWLPRTWSDTEVGEVCQVGGKREGWAGREREREKRTGCPQKVRTVPRMSNTPLLGVVLLPPISMSPAAGPGMRVTASLW